MIYIQFIIINFFLFSFTFSTDTTYIEKNIDSSLNVVLSNQNSLIKTDGTIQLPKYLGGWPYNVLKDQIIGSTLYYNCPNEIGCDCKTNNDCINSNCKKSPRGSYCYPKEGDVFPEFISVDQYEENINLYDFANQGKYILVELAAAWCAPCNDLASWFAYRDESIYSKPWWKKDYEKIYDLVHNDKIYFITVLYEDENHDLVSYDTSYEWFDNYPDEKIPVLLDFDKSLHAWVKPTGIPTIILLNEKMEIVQFTTRGLNSSFDQILKLLNDDYEK